MLTGEKAKEGIRRVGGGGGGGGQDKEGGQRETSGEKSEGSDMTTVARRECVLTRKWPRRLYIR